MRIISYLPFGLGLYWAVRYRKIYPFQSGIGIWEQILYTSNSHLITFTFPSKNFDLKTLKNKCINCKNTPLSLGNWNASRPHNHNLMTSVQIVTTKVSFFAITQKVWCSKRTLLHRSPSQTSDLAAELELWQQTEPEGKIYINYRYYKQQWSCKATSSEMGLICKY